MIMSEKERRYNANALYEAELQQMQLQDIKDIAANAYKIKETPESLRSLVLAREELAKAKILTGRYRVMVRAYPIN